MGKFCDTLAEKCMDKTAEDHEKLYFMVEFTRKVLKSGKSIDELLDGQSIQLLKSGSYSDILEILSNFYLNSPKVNLPSVIISKSKKNKHYHTRFLNDG